MDLSVSQIMSDTFRALKRHFWGLLGVYLIFLAIIIGMFVVFTMAVGGSAFAMAAGGADPETMAGGMSAGFMLFAVLFYIAYFLVYCAQLAAMTRLASPLHATTVGEAMSVGFRSSPTLLVTLILLGIVTFVAALLLGAVFAALAQLGSAGTLIGVLLVAGLALWLACRLAVVFPLVPVEGVRNPIVAISRSWSLTRGHVLPIFLAMLLFVVIMIALFAVAIVPMMGSFAGLAAGEVAPSFGAMGLGFVLILLVSVLIGMAYAALLAAIHARLAGTSSERLDETFG